MCIRDREYDALIRYAEAIPGVDSTQVIDSILYVYTQGGYEWFYDMYGLSVAAPADYSIDPAQLQAELDSLRIAWGGFDSYRRKLFRSCFTR